MLLVGLALLICPLINGPNVFLKLFATVVLTRLEILKLSSNQKELSCCACDVGDVGSEGMLEMQVKCSGKSLTCVPAHLQ